MAEDPVRRIPNTALMGMLSGFDGGSKQALSDSLRVPVQESVYSRRVVHHVPR